MNNQNNLLGKRNFDWNTWGLAIRLRTLPAAAAGVITGSALAWFDGYFRLDAALACLLTAILLQIGSNLANDVFDFERGTDTAERAGPIRVTQAGLLTPSQVKWGMLVVFGLAALCGLYLAWLGGWPIVILGIAAILSAIAYTGGPFPLGYYGLGDVFVFIFFGLASVAGTYYVQAGFVSTAAWWMAIPPGLIITAILVVNNLRDLENDRKGGKHTLAVILGERGSKAEYLSLHDCGLSYDSLGCSPGHCPGVITHHMGMSTACHSYCQNCLYPKGTPAQCRSGRDRAGRLVL